ncbi:hypothetical protein [Plantactinospora sp. CA-290183]|uniref:hypothetical protein n=1 Tax=Plantactinospora sp. CA-290183 TaxID=3240006 RepID=UPI003D936060
MNANPDPGTGYAALVRQLAELSGEADARRAEADAWYERQCASAERAVQDAELAVRRAEAELAAAREEVERTDAEVTVLWSTLRGLLGGNARRLGDAPVPTRGPSENTEALLDGARELLERARRPGELPSSTQPLLVLFGVLGAGAAYALGLAARAAGARYGGDLAVGLPVLGLLVSLLGPVVGLAPAKVLAERRYAGLDVRAVLLVVVAGLATTGALFALFR